MKRTSTLLLIASLLIACGNSETTTPDEEPSPDADACEHLEGGPFAPITAGGDTGSATPAGESHTAYQITLPDGGMDMFVGTVSFTVDEAVEILFFTDEPVPFALTDSAGAEVTLEDTCTSGTCSIECAMVAGRHVADFDTVGTYVISLGPTASSELTLVHFEGGHDHEHDE